MLMKSYLRENIIFDSLYSLHLNKEIKVTLGNSHGYRRVGYI